MSAPFEPGERALLVDRKGRRYMITLRSGEEFHTHHGAVPHDSIIGSPEGITVQSTSGVAMICFRPSIVDFILKMPRGAQVIYPKDIGMILVLADVGPGMTVLEAGTGSGALAIALSRAVGERGRLVSYEIREDFHERARSNLETFLGKLPPSVELRLGDITSGVPERDADRMILDFPEPWRAIPSARESLRPGAIFCSYVPTVMQVSRTVEELRGAGFSEIETIEALVRSWHVEGQSVRPDHRMVAHTGFITTARFLGA